MFSFNDYGFGSNPVPLSNMKVWESLFTEFEKIMRSISYRLGHERDSFYMRKDNSRTFSGSLLDRTLNWQYLIIQMAFLYHSKTDVELFDDYIRAQLSADYTDICEALKVFSDSNRTNLTGTMSVRVPRDEHGFVNPNPLVWYRLGFYCVEDDYTEMLNAIGNICLTDYALAKAIYKQDWNTALKVFNDFQEAYNVIWERPI